MSQQQRSRPTKAPMRGQSGPGPRRRPPMGSAPAQNVQPQSQRVRSNRGRGRGGRGSRGRARQPYPQRNYPANYNAAPYLNADVNAQNVQVQPQVMQVVQDAPVEAIPSDPSAAQAQKPRSRPPMKAQNNAMFAQFNAPQQQQQQHQQQQQQQQQAQAATVTDAQAQANIVTSAAAVKQEEKSAVVSGADAQQKVASAQQEKKPMKPVKRQPPWIEFTGSEKDAPIACGWAHRVRQVLSADTLRVALLKPRNRDPLEPPDIIQITLDGITAPRCQRWEPTNKKGRGGRKKRKEQKEDGAGGTGSMNVDDPYAFEAREFVREKVLNKNIIYAVWKSNTQMSNQFGKPIPRYWGDIYYQESKGGQTYKSLTTELVTAGLATLKEPIAPQTRVNTDLSEKEKTRLKKKMEEAKTKKLNIHSENKERVRKIEWIAWDKQKDFGDANKGKVLRGIVDQVISGSTIRVELETNKKQNEYKNVVVNIAGINCPKVLQQRAQSKGKSGGSGQDFDDALSKPFGIKAREWSEERLLGQIVNVKICCTSNRQIIAQIIHEKGRIAPSLLKKGLAQYQKWSAKLTDKDEQKLLLATSEHARKQRLNIWGILDPAKCAVSNEERVTVIQVKSGDTVVVAADINSDKSEQYTLSSIRAPRLGTRGGFVGGKRFDKSLATPDEYLAREAKEYVRQMCIGKEVRLIFEYEREAQFVNNKKRFDKKKFASIYVTDKKGKEVNIALELIKKGYAELVWHSKNEPNRSADYAFLEQSFEKARKEKKGLNQFITYDKNKQAHVPDDDRRKKKARETAIKDFSGIQESSIRLDELIGLNNYLTSGEVRGVVEFIFGANRVKVYIPDKRVCIAVRLADIRCGNWTVDARDSKDPERDAAKKYLNRTILQRDITLLITSTNQDQIRGRGRRRGRGKGRGRGGNIGTRNPNLDGHIFYKGKNVAEYLLENGLASVITRRYPQSISAKNTIPKNFYTLQEKAKDEKLGIWSNEADEYEGDDAKNDQRLQELIKRSKTGQETEVIVSHIESATLFYVNDANSDAMVRMNVEMEELAKNPKIPKTIRTGKAQKNVKFAAKYDGYYARARVNNKDKRNLPLADDKDAKGGDKEEYAYYYVSFIDYGNKARISRKQFTELPAELRTDRIPALATRCELAGIDVYDKNDRAYNDAGYFFSRYVFQSENQKLRMKILYHEPQVSQYQPETYHVELFVGDKSINQLIAREGFVTMIKERDLRPAFVHKKEHKQDWSQEHVAYVEKYFEEIKACINAAKDEHKNIFYHGDIDSGEDDNFPSGMGGKKGTKSRR